MAKEHEHIRSPPSQYHSATLNLKYLVQQESTCDFFEIYTKTREKNQEIAREHEHIRSPPSPVQYLVTLHLNLFFQQEITCDFFEIKKMRDKNQKIAREHEHIRSPPSPVQHSVTLHQIRTNRRHIASPRLTSYTILVISCTAPSSIILATLDYNNNNKKY